MLHFPLSKAVRLRSIRIAIEAGSVWSSPQGGAAAELALLAQRHPGRRYPFTARES